MTKTVYIVPIEKLESRYTSEWYNHIPEDLQKYALSLGIDIKIETIDGKELDDNVTPGAFLDFAGTNIWKSSQLEKIAEKFRAGLIKEGDIFLYTDAWNPTIIQLKYMSELLHIPIKIIGIFHAGSWDPEDFLGRLIGDAPWVRHAEKAMFESIDYSIFATQFHVDMFRQVMNYCYTESKIVRSGFPMNYYVPLHAPYSHKKYEDRKPLITFPHRKAPEKQLNIFLDLAKELPEYEWKVCQDIKLTKNEYHTILGESKIIFSANLQETLGLGVLQGIFSNSMVFVPDRLSYQEMYYDDFKYPSEWTENFDSYIANKDKLIAKIRKMIDMNNIEVEQLLTIQKEKLIKEFIDPTILYNKILGV